MKKLILSGSIGYEITVDSIRNFVNDAAGADLEIHLASPGGSVFDGIEIFNIFRDYKREHPKSQMLLTIKGIAASMASYVAVNPVWDLIAAEDNAVFMIHNAWGGVVGDYREVGKLAEVLEGLTKIIAQAYSKRTKQNLADIRSLMDDETWYFGEELKKAGFIDEIIKTDTKKSKATAITEARIQFDETRAKFPPIDQSGITKIAAMIKSEPDKNEKELKTGSTPAQETRDNNKTEVMSMTLEQFLAENPAARNELDKMLKEKFDAGVKKAQETIAAVEPYMKPDSEYPAPIRSLAVDVINGKCDIGSLRASVATYDALKEKKISQDAKEESDDQSDVKGQQQPEVSSDGMINNEADFSAEISRTKKLLGMEVN